MERCRDCKYFSRSYRLTDEAASRNNDSGYNDSDFLLIQRCQRFPNFVDRRLDDWCGEFKPTTPPRPS